MAVVICQNRCFSPYLHVFVCFTILWNQCNNPHSFPSFPMTIAFSKHQDTSAKLFSKPVYQPKHWECLTSLPPSPTFGSSITMSEHLCKTFQWPGHKEPPRSVTLQQPLYFHLDLKFNKTLQKAWAALPYAQLLPRYFRKPEATKSTWHKEQ